jgi:FKBP-type peptidyl-prolyl cis-trans isomerase FkpA
LIYGSPQAYGADMTTFPRAPRLLASALALPLLAAPLCANAATPAPAPNTEIIPLPLEPIVPAGQRACANTTPSGLGYTMLREGPGPKPAAADTVLIDYIGYLAASGTVFDQAMRSPLPVGEVIPGFSEGLQLLGKTGVVRLCVPAALAYGADATGPIPANSDLVFQVELLDFKTAAEIEAMQKSQPVEGLSQDEGAIPQ